MACSSLHTFKHHESSSRKLRIGYVFGPQSSHYAGMGKEMYEFFPKFRETFDAMNSIYTNHTGNCLKNQFWSEPTDINVDLDSAEVCSAGILAIQLSLVKLLEEFGVKPSTIVSFSLGEYAAAVTSGVISAADAMRFVVGRGCILKDANIPESRMTVLNASVERVETLLSDFKSKYPNTELEISGSNTNNSSVVAGFLPFIDAFEQFCQESNISFRRLYKSIRYPYHTCLMDPILDNLYTLAKEIKHSAPQIPCVSSSLGRFVSEDDLNTNYWVQMTRQRVLLSQATQEFIPHVDIIIEIAPHPIAPGVLVQNGCRKKILSLMEMKPKSFTFEPLLHSLFWLEVSGYSVNWIPWVSARSSQILPSCTNGRIIVNQSMNESIVINSLERASLVNSDEVEIEVTYCSLNNEDIAACLPSDCDKSVRLGFEVCGVLKRIGEEALIRGLSIGDHVNAVVLAGGGIFSHVVVPHGHVQRCETSLNAGASTISWSSLIAWKVLLTLGGIGSDTTVFVDCCLEWVGLPFIQIAQHFGATVYVLVGNQSGKERMSCLGVKNIYIIHDFEAWDEKIRCDTNSNGVSIVVNAFAENTHRQKCLKVLNLHGKFFDLSHGSKNDWWEDLGSKLRPDVTYHKVDLKNESSFWITSTLHQIWEGIRKGWIQEIPSNVFPIECLGMALELLNSRKFEMAKPVLIISSQNQTESA